MNPFVLSAICILGFMCLFYVIALWQKNNGLADIGWGLGFIMVAFVTFHFYSESYFQQKLITFLTMIWGLRLSAYLFIRNWGRPEDFRYAQWRQEWGSHAAVRSFFQVFILQGCIMFINALPIIIVNSTPRLEERFNWFYLGGSVVIFIGFFFESAADWHMYMFRSDPHKHGILKTGLWKYTRHPNYFGEALLWWGMFLLAVPSGKWYISILAPITITYLLLRVSGVTMLEKKYEGNSEYDEYKRTTSAFIPWFPKKG